MTYNPGIPQPTDRPSVSQGQILINFGQIEDVFSENHIPLDDLVAVNRGKHNFVSFVGQPNEPSQPAATPPTSATDCALYSAFIDATTHELFFKYDTNVLGSPSVQLTNIAPPVSNATGSTWLPGGMMMQWGILLAIPTGTTAVVFATPFTADPYSIQLTARSNVNGISVAVSSAVPPTTNGFSAVNRTGNSAVDVYWLAIGPTT